jgi:hypothetical protein
MSGVEPVPPTSPSSTEVARGIQRSVVYAQIASGDEPARRFRSSLDEDCRNRFLVLFRQMGDHGKITNDQRFRPALAEKHCTERGSIARFNVGEFKVGLGPGYRIFAVAEGRAWVLTHGETKPKPKQLKTEIERAGRYYCEDRLRRIAIREREHHDSQRKPRGKP